MGDDVYGEDPTVNRLEQRAAEITGKEAALFVPTGTMGNTIGVKVHTQHGQEVICEARAHVLNYELAMMAWFSGCVARPIFADGGILSWAQINSEIRPLGPHWAPTGLIEIENTHNMGGGTVYPMDMVREICDGAHELGLKVHMDGARVFNAAQALGVRVQEIVAPVDTVMFCLSKALGAPVGSMLAGTREDMARARLYRKRLGGGMRQAGVLAAAGTDCARRPSAPAGARSRQRAISRGSAGEDSRDCNRSAQGRDQYPDLRRQRHRAFHSGIQRAAQIARRADQRNQRPRDAHRDALRRGPRRLRAGSASDRASGGGAVAGARA